MSGRWVWSWPHFLGFRQSRVSWLRRNSSPTVRRCVSQTEKKRGDDVASRYFSPVFFFLVFTSSWYFLIRDFLQHLWRLSLVAPMGWNSAVWHVAAFESSVSGDKKQVEQIFEAVFFFFLGFDLQFFFTLDQLIAVKYSRCLLLRELSCLFDLRFCNMFNIYLNTCSSSWFTSTWCFCPTEVDYYIWFSLQNYSYFTFSPL